MSGAFDIHSSEICIRILYQDDRLLAVDKPSRMLVHPTRIDAGESVSCVKLLSCQLGHPVYPCHRLDKPTSGVLLFATDKEALSAVNSIFSMRKITKEYLAVVRGWVPVNGIVDYPLAYQPDGGEKRGRGLPQPAVTEFQLVIRYELPEAFGKFPTNRYSLVRLYPKTGRQHQIRRHLKHIFHPVIGDTRYGDGAHNRFFRDRFDCHRLLLHAASLQFEHPFTGQPTTIRSELPREFHIPLPIRESFSKSGECRISSS